MLICLEHHPDWNWERAFVHMPHLDFRNRNPLSHQPYHGLMVPLQCDAHTSGLEATIECYVHNWDSRIICWTWQDDTRIRMLARREVEDISDCIATAKLFNVTLQRSLPKPADIPSNEICDMFQQAITTLYRGFTAAYQNNTVYNLPLHRPGPET